MKKSASLFVVVAIVGISACSNGTDPREQIEGASVATTAPVPSGFRIEEGVPGPLPARATSSDEVDRDFDNGQEMFITDDGFRPRSLLVKVNAELLFVNETDDVARVRFTNFDFRSSPIAPGESASFTPETIASLVVELEGADDVNGTIQVESYHEPGETAESS